MRQGQLYTLTLTGGPLGSNSIVFRGIDVDAIADPFEGRTPRDAPIALQGALKVQGGTIDNYYTASRGSLTSYPKRLRKSDLLEAVKLLQAEGITVEARRGVQGGGGRTPDSSKVSRILDKQTAWKHLNDSYAAIPESIRGALPPPPPAPLFEMPQPFLEYIEEEADHEALEEARMALAMISPQELQLYLAGSPSRQVESVLGLYEAALPDLNEHWLPLVFRSEVYTTLVSA
jgi:hypothetical protein